MRAYDRGSLAEAYHAIGVRPGQTIYLTGNLGRLGFPSEKIGVQIRDKTAIAEMHISVIEDLLGPYGTIAFPTHSWKEIDLDTIFDPITTGCDYPLSQHILKTRKCRRQVHPFASIAATGAKAALVIDEHLSKHVYGIGSPMDRLTEENALHVSIALPVAGSISAVHHCEVLAQVPYRYVKAFQKDIRMNGRVTREELFLHVLFRSPGLILERDQNVKITALPRITEALCEVPIGRSRIASVPLGVFVSETVAAMRHDPFIWLRNISGDRPWEK